MVSAKIARLVMSYSMTEIPTNTSVPAKNTTFIGRQMVFVTVNFNKAHVQKAIGENKSKVARMLSITAADRIESDRNF